MTKSRLKERFSGFDSIDPRMERVPNDLNDPKIREEYLKNHIQWFLKNHEDSLKVFYDEVNKKYGDKIKKSESDFKELPLFSSKGGITTQST